MMKKITLILMILMGLCTRNTAAQSVAQCAPMDARNGSRLCVTLGFGKGKLVVDRSLSRLNPSPQFTRLLTRMTVEQAQTLFFNEIDQALAVDSKPYRLALSDAELKKDDDGQLNDQKTVELRGFDGSWKDYQGKFTVWASESTGRQSFFDLFGLNALAENGLYYPLTVIGNSTALIFNDDDPDLGPGYSLETATFSFTVVDPVADWSDANQVTIVFPDVADEAKQANLRRRIQDQLKVFNGQVWNPSAIKQKISAYYHKLGLQPTVFVSSAADRLTVTVLEAPRIVGIVLPAQKVGESVAEYNSAIDKILYTLMPDADFRAFIRMRKEIIVPLSSELAAVPFANGVTVNYSDLNRTGPYLNQSRLQVQQLALSQLGYVVNLQQGETSDVKQDVFLAVNKISDTKQAPKNTPEEAPATATPSGVVTAKQQEETRKTEFTPKDKTEGEPLKEHKNYLGGGFEYRPGQGVRLFGLGQRSRLQFPFQEGSVSATGGGGNGGGLGSFNYFADYVGFGWLHRRLSLQANYSSDIDPNRLMNDQEMDERRTTGMARVEFEPFRDKGGSLLRFYAEGRQALVTLKAKDAAESKQHLTTLDVGSLLTYESVYAEYPKRLRLEPQLRFGLGLAVGAPSFTKLIFTSNYHQALPRRMAADISGRLEMASQDTPSFELPSFGGADVVRGFRRDDALGRRLWSLQNELWLPLPHTATDDEAGFKAFLRDSVRLAPFVDIGGLYSPSMSKAGVRSGYGLGLRITYNVVTFKLDYAYGVGAAAGGGSRGKFYFGVASNLPF
jgi:hypothetical protein